MVSRSDSFFREREQVSYLKIQEVLHPLYEGLNFIGRRKDATVIIENHAVSQHQAVIIVNAEKHFVSDVGSSNGSFLDQNKLQPLLLYELTDGSILHFACVAATYINTPSDTQLAHVQRQNTKETLNDSIYVAHTQQLELENPSQVFQNCFDDDYDFSDVLATQNSNRVLSIHDLPTQFFSSAAIEEGTLKDDTLVKAKKSNAHEVSACTDAGEDISNFHEMSTQIILDESDLQNEISITSTNVHELPTQIMVDEISNSNVSKNIEDTEDKVVQQISKPLQEPQIEISNTSIESIVKIREQNDLEVKKLNCEIDEYIMCQPSTSKGVIINPEEPNNLEVKEINCESHQDVLCSPSNSKNIVNTNVTNENNSVIYCGEHGESIVNISEDVIDNSALENLSENVFKPDYLSLKTIDKLTEAEPVISQSFLKSQSVGNLIKKKCQPINYSESSSEANNIDVSQNADEIKTLGRHKMRINSDSDTDIGELTAEPNAGKSRDSESATDIEKELNLSQISPIKKRFKKRKKIQKIDSDSETDMENSNKRHDSSSDTDVENIDKPSTSSPIKKNIMCLKKQVNELNVLDSDTDIDNDESMVGLKSKINAPVMDEGDSEIIPCIQFSDDDDDDFNLGIEKHSTILEKTGLTDDISQNFSLRLSAYTELSEEANTKPGDSSGKSNSSLLKAIQPVETTYEQLAEIQPVEINPTNESKSFKHSLEIEKSNSTDREAVSPLKESQENDNLLIQPEQAISGDKKYTHHPTQKDSSSKQSTQPLVDCLFQQPTQKIATSSTNKNLFSCPTQPIINEKSTCPKSDHFLNQPTQPLNDDNLFLQPNQEDSKDELFMQSTQKMVEHETLFNCPTQPIAVNKNIGDDLFLQPSQKIHTSLDKQNDNDLFLQPTQMIDTRLNKQNDDLFLQPTQKIDTGLDKQNEDDLFLQPTQKIDTGLDKQNEDDLFLQPTQKIDTGLDKQNEDELFLQPTQKIDTGSDKQDDDDLFLQPTQMIDTNLNKENDDLFLQPTQKIDTGWDKQNEDELFLQPTQKIDTGSDKQNEDDLFLQPTQKIDTVLDKQNDDYLFLQPTQKIDNSLDKQNDDLFLQPTQKINTSLDKQKEDDLFLQPTQKINANLDNQNDDDLFLQPTQKIDSSCDKQNKGLLNQLNPQPIVENNLFLQPTKAITLPSKNKLKDMSPKKVLPENSEKEGSTVESQLEVLFSSQFLEPLIGTNNRPSNPLATILEGNYVADSQDICADAGKLESKSDVSTIIKDKNDSQIKNKSEEILLKGNNLDSKAGTNMIERSTPNTIMLNTRSIRNTKLLKQSKEEEENDCFENNESESKLQKEKSNTNKIVKSKVEVENVETLSKEPVTKAKSTDSLNKPESSRNSRAKNSKSDECLPKNVTNSLIRKSARMTRTRKVEDAVEIVDETTITETNIKNKVDKKIKTLGEVEIDDVHEIKMQAGEIDKSGKHSARTESADLVNTVESIIINKERNINEKQCLTEKINSAGNKPMRATTRGKKIEDKGENKVVLVTETTSRKKITTERRSSRSESTESSKKADKVKRTVIIEANSKEIETPKKLTKTNNTTEASSKPTRVTKRGKKIEDEIETNDKATENEVDSKSNDDNWIQVKKQVQSEAEILVSEVKATIDKIDKKIVTRRRSTRSESIESIKKTENVKSGKVINAVPIFEENETLKMLSKAKNTSETNSKPTRATRGRKIEESFENKVDDKCKDNKKMQTQSESEKIVLKAKAAVDKKVATRRCNTRSESTESLKIAESIGKGKLIDSVSEESETPKLLSKTTNTIQESNEKSVALTVTRNTRRNNGASASKEIISEGKPNSSTYTISSCTDSGDDDIILNTPRGNKRQLESQTSLANSKKLKSINMSPKSVSSARKGKRIIGRTDTLDVPSTPIKRSKTDESDMMDSSSSSKQSEQTSCKSLNLSSSFDTPTRNKRKQKPKVVFTMLDSPELESLIRSLGGTVVDTVNACTVLVTGALKRSQKLLSAVGQSKPICSPNWLQECKKKSTFLDPWDFILEDKEAETKWSFSLKESLYKSQNQKLLQNYVVLILTTTSVDVLKAAIESCGGKCVPRAPPSNTKDFIVVALPENKGKYAKFIKQKITVVTPEAIFDGVLRQELHFENHLLS